MLGIIIHAGVALCKGEEWLKVCKEALAQTGAKTAETITKDVKPRKRSIRWYGILPRIAFRMPINSLDGTTWHVTRIPESPLTNWSRLLTTNWTKRDRRTSSLYNGKWTVWLLCWCCLVPCIRISNRLTKKGQERREEQTWFGQGFGHLVQGLEV